MATSKTRCGGAPAGSGGGAGKRAAGWSVVSGECREEYGRRLGFCFESRDDQSTPYNVHRVELDQTKGNIVQKEEN